MEYAAAHGMETGSAWSWTVLAEDHRGRSERATVRAWFLPHPLFDGCSRGRREEIEEALLEICGLLQQGCLMRAAGLDHSVAAFRDGHLTRVQLIDDMARQLWNLHLITFRCADVADADWRGGLWDEFSNQIELQWSPSHRPNLAYLIFHELVQKVGFNGDLSAFYTDAQIESQAREVARTCFPQIPHTIPGEE